jgi:hypothetical protein
MHGHDDANRSHSVIERLGELLLSHPALRTNRVGDDEEEMDLARHEAG